MCFSRFFTLGIKGYLLFDLQTRSLFTSIKTIFHENVFPYKPLHSTQTNSQQSRPPNTSTIPFLFDIDHTPYTPPIQPNPTSIPGLTPTVTDNSIEHVPADTIIITLLNIITLIMKDIPLELDLHPHI